MKTKLIFLTILLVVPLLINGCASDFVSPANAFDHKILKTQQKYLENNITNWEGQYYASIDVARQTQLRDQIVYSIMSLNDEYYRKWVSDFYGRSAALPQ